MCLQFIILSQQVQKNWCKQTWYHTMAFVSLSKIRSDCYPFNTLNIESPCSSYAFTSHFPPTNLCLWFASLILHIFWHHLHNNNICDFSWFLDNHMQIANQIKFQLYIHLYITCFCLNDPKMFHLQLKYHQIHSPQWSKWSL
jgi:hypothetical protein